MKSIKKVKLKIAEPCHENWDAMVPEDKSRFCNSCAKSVIDFSGLTDAHVLAIMDAHKDKSVCGRFSVNQLSRDFSYTQTIDSNSISLRAMLIGASLTTLISLSSCAQEEPKIMGEVAYVPEKLMGDTIVVESDLEDGPWKGVFLDHQSRLPVKNVVVSFIDVEGNVVQNIEIPETGKFSIDLKTVPTFENIFVTAPNYESKTIAKQSIVLDNDTVFDLYNDFIKGKIVRQDN